MTAQRSRWRRWLVRGGLALLLVLVVGYFGVAAYVASQLTLTQRHALESDPQADGLNVEDVTFSSYGDDTQLSGWLLHADDDQSRVIVMVHGYNSGRDDPNTGLYPLAQGLLEQHFSVLMFDLRGYGSSAGDRFSLGWYEQNDVRGAIRFAQQQGFQHIGVLGFSMGAASSLLATAQEPAVEALVEDSAYADLPDLMSVEIPKRSGLPSIFTPGVLLMARVMYGIDAWGVIPADAAAQLGERPLFVIHGAQDDFIPPANSEQIWHARYGSGDIDPATFYLVPDSWHVKGFKHDQAAYLERVGTFFQQHLGSQAAMQ